MHVLEMWFYAELLPKNIDADELADLVTTALQSHSIPADIVECEVFECPTSALKTIYAPKYWLFGAPTAKHRRVRSIKRQGRIGLLYFPESRALEDAFTDIATIESATHLQFHNWGYYSPNAIITEISPIIRCGLSKNNVTVDGYENHKPPDYTTITIRMWGQVPSVEARGKLLKIADYVCEPILERDGKFSTSFPYGGSTQGPIPEVVIAKRFDGFDRNAAAAFVERICAINQEYTITDWTLLEGDGFRSTASTYPLHQIQVMRYGEQQDEHGRWPLYQIGFSFPFVGKKHKHIVGM